MQQRQSRLGMSVSAMSGFPSPGKAAGTRDILAHVGVSVPRKGLTRGF